MKPMRVVLVVAALGPGMATAASLRSGQSWCGTTRSGARDAVWAHREQAQRGPERVRAATRLQGYDVGDIAVLLDAGDLGLRQNFLDLQGAALRFTPTGPGYSVSRIELPLLPDAGSRLALGDDASTALDLGFAFPFYGRTYDRVNVNSDGNLTFQEPDPASTARNLGRLTSGPPRIAPLLSDLDPSSSGSVSVQLSAGRLVVTWTAVPRFGELDANTFQLTLAADGQIDFAYSRQTSVGFSEAVVGIAPGRDQGGVTTLDLSAAAANGGAGALAESFRDEDGIDTVAVARRFLATHADAYQQLVIFTDRRSVPSGTFAFEQTVRSADDGIGATRFDVGAEYGSPATLQSVVLMDFIGKYVEPFSTRFLGEDSSLSVLGHEVGHRWLAQARFLDGGVSSGDLLGRDEVHWSFFMDTDASHLEGNDIEDQGGGRFRTTAAALRYSALDQYLMGLRPASEVPPFFVVRAPGGTPGGTDPGRTPRSSISFTGVRKDVTIEDVVAAIGPRSPAFPEAPRELSQAFVFVSLTGTPSAADLDKVERLRQAWPGFHAASTDGRGAVETRLH